MLFVVAIIYGALTVTTLAGAHPGGTDEEGCHACRSSCDKWDLEEDERHCHGEDSEDDEDAADDSDDGDEGDDGDEDDPDLSENGRVYVDKVLDGDTLVVRPLDGKSDRIRIRVLGIDCPESHKNPKCRRQGREGGPGCEEQIPRGKKAAKRVAELIDGQVVRLESGEEDGEFDRGGYDRVLAYIRLEDGRDLGKYLIEQDLCRDYGDKYPHPRHEAYQEASP
jgi:micrococcal nuclease